MKCALFRRKVTYEKVDQVSYLISYYCVNNPIVIASIYVSSQGLEEPYGLFHFPIDQVTLNSIKNAVDGGSMIFDAGSVT